MNPMDKIKELLEGKGKLLYLTKFGSHLYGTDNPNSDLDLKGVFLPSITHFFSGDNIKQITYSTGGSVGKNSKDDVDITLYTLQYFLHHLVSKGDTGALDLLFSYTNRNCVLYDEYNLMKRLTDNLHKILNLKDSNAYIGYAIGQAKKYGIKGSRLGVFKSILNLLEGDLREQVSLNKKLVDVASTILRDNYDESYCFQKSIKNVEYLVVCGACHQLNTSLPEFYTRIQGEVKKYGDRSNTALEAGGIDYKALSHAVRVLSQCEELYEYGTITFPRPDRDILLLVKEGRIEYKGVEELILRGLRDADTKRHACKYDYSYSNKFCTQLIKELYD